ncbi:MAG: prolipoprotein diacylglyceryl transferase [Oscillospiraceae bacterium]|jgi:phosphatidylglycerol:prolipoprotein diacylglycerol transferase|nr:prolipoprotein diacylglyceryl transferase [Oscillospiraceae bacterium]
MGFKFLGDYAWVKFTAIDKIFEIPSTAFYLELFGKEIEIKWYGIIIAFGFTLAVLFGGRMAYKWKMDLNKMLDILIYGTFGGIIGARLYFVFSHWEYYGQEPLQILNLRGGGLAIYGGLIGGIIGAYITCRFNKLNFYNLLDMAAMSFLIGQGIGRWGNFMNQEAFGTNTDLPWGMWSEKIASSVSRELASLEAGGMIMDPTKPVHPTFLYESIWCLAGFGILYLICRKARKFSGQLFLCYGVWYGIGRFFFEGLRTDSLYLGSTNIRTSQALSAVLVVACAVVLVMKLVKYTKNPQPVEGVDFFPEPAPKKGEAAGKSAVAVLEEMADEEQADAPREPQPPAGPPETDAAQSEPKPDSAQEGEE